MKKILVSAVFLSFVAFAPAAHAYTLVNGEPVFGYVRGIAPQPTSEQAFVEKMQIPVEPVIDTFGNTRVIDLIKIIRPQDIQAFLQIIKNAKLSY